MTAWAVVTVTVAAVSALGSAWGAVAVKERFDRRRAERRERLDAYRRLIAAVEALSLQAVNNHIAGDWRSALVRSVVSSGRFVMTLLGLGLPAVRRRLGTAEVGLLISTMVFPDLPVVQYSNLDMVGAFVAVQEAAATVELVGSSTVTKLADELMTATRELVDFTAPRLALRQPRRTSAELVARRDGMEHARVRLVEAVRAELRVKA